MQSLRSKQGVKLSFKNCTQSAISAYSIEPWSSDPLKRPPFYLFDSLGFTSSEYLKGFS